MEAALPSGYRVHVHDAIELLKKSAARGTASDAYDRDEAVSALAALRGTEFATQATERVISFLDDADYFVQAAACRTLGALGVASPEVVSALLGKAHSLQGEKSLYKRGTFEDAVVALIELGQNGEDARRFYAQASYPGTQMLIAEKVPCPFEILKPAIMQALTEEKLAIEQKVALDLIKAIGPSASPTLRCLVQLNDHLSFDPISILSGVPNFLLKLRDEAVSAINPSNFKFAYERAIYWFARTKRNGFISSALDFVLG